MLRLAFSPHSFIPRGKENTVNVERRREQKDRYEGRNCKRELRYNSFKKNPLQNVEGILCLFCEAFPDVRPLLVLVFKGKYGGAK